MHANPLKTTRRLSALISWTYLPETLAHLNFLIAREPLLHCDFPVDHFHDVCLAIFQHRCRCQWATLATTSWMPSRTGRFFFTDSHGRQLISSSGHLGAIQRHYLFDWFRPERKIGSWSDFSRVNNSLMCPVFSRGPRTLLGLLDVLVVMVCPKSLGLRHHRYRRPPFLPRNQKRHGQPRHLNMQSSVVQRGLWNWLYRCLASGSWSDVF